MRSGHPKARHCLGAVVLLVGIVAAAPARAAPRVVCIDDGSAASTDLRARIDGQTRDLGLQLRFVTDAQLPELDPPAFRALAARNAAELLVLVRRQANGGIVVYVYDVVHASLRERAVPPPRSGERLAASRAAETVALIVRGELALALGPPAGVETGAAARSGATGGTQTGAGGASASPGSRGSPSGVSGNDAPTGGGERNDERTTRRTTGTVAPGARPAGTEPAAPEDGAGEPDLSARLDLAPRLSISVAMQTTLPGFAHPFLGPQFALRLSLLHFELAVLGASSFSQTLARNAATIRLHHHAVSAELLAWLNVRPTLELGIGASAGLALYARKASANAGFEATPATTLLSSAVGPVLQLRWEFAHSIGVSARLGVNFVQSPVRFALERALDRTRKTLLQLPFYEAWAGLALFADLWK